MVFLLEISIEFEWIWYHLSILIHIIYISPYNLSQYYFERTWDHQKTWAWMHLVVKSDHRIRRGSPVSHCDQVTLEKNGVLVAWDLSNGEGLGWYSCLIFCWCTLYTWRFLIFLQPKTNTWIFKPETGDSGLECKHWALGHWKVRKVIYFEVIPIMPKDVMSPYRHIQSK